MEEKYEKNMISEFKYFNASSKNRKKFEQVFLKKATKNPKLILPYQNFDIARSRNRGIERLIETKEKIIIQNEKLELERKTKNIRSEESKLYLARNQENLKRIEVVETARAIQLTPTFYKKRKFNRLNFELYGGINKKFFKKLLSEKKYRIEKFEPKNELAKNLKRKILESDCLKNIESHEEKMPELLTKELNKLLKKKYQCIFDLIDEKKNYDAESAKQIFSKIMKNLNFDWKVCVSDSVSVVTDSSTSQTLKLPKNLKRTGRELKRLAIHEIGVHTARAINGRKNGGMLLEFGTKNYLRAEEGLATLCECSLEKDFDNESFKRISYRYLVAGFAMGVDGKKRNAIEVFNLIVPFMAIEHSKNGKISEKDLEKALDDSYRHIENAFRGTDWLTRGMAFLKLKIYYEGFMENVKFFEKNINDLESAFDLAMLGKYDHTKKENIKDVLLLMDIHKKPPPV